MGLNNLLLHAYFVSVLDDAGSPEFVFSRVLLLPEAIAPENAPNVMQQVEDASGGLLVSITPVEVSISLDDLVSRLRKRKPRGTST